MKYINFFDGSGIKKGPFLDPFLWHNKTRPNALNKRFDGWLLILIFFLENVVFCLFGSQKRVLWRAFFRFLVWEGSCNEQYWRVHFLVGFFYLRSFFEDDKLHFSYIHHPESKLEKENKKNGAE